MSKLFKNVNSFEDLKKQYKELLKANHPDNGGDVEKMQEINIEYDALFRIWKDRQEKETGETVEETANSTRFEFYTMNGWAGSNYNSDLSLKEIAKIVRTYIKEKYPTYKFSVRTSYASMCQELHVELKESPVEIYKPFEDLTEEDKRDLRRRMMRNDYFKLDCWTDEELKVEFERIWEEYGDFYRCLNEVTKAVVEDVDAFVKSYNYSDCDGMIDYFDVNFYYFGCCDSNGRYIKVVPKTARISKAKSEIKKAEPKKDESKESNQIEEKKSYTFKVTEGNDTRDGSVLWVVRIEETLSKEEYIRINKAIKEIGGYYSKFKHGFIFRFEPSEELKKVA